jgi:hypothetical protein
MMHFLGPSLWERWTGRRVKTRVDHVMLVTIVANGGVVT